METSLYENAAGLELPIRWDERLARLISEILSPPVTILLSLILVAQMIPEPSAWLWLVFAALAMIGAPVAFILWQVRSGVISDFHIPIRTQRVRPMLVMAACTSLTWAIMAAGKAPRLLLILVSLGIIHLLATLLITLRWKISGHSAAIAGLALLIVNQAGLASLPCLALIPLVAWARVRIRRHTIAQTIAGACSGLLFVSLALWLA
jgi:membrane-associated phospholipid phosphatase